MSERDFSGCVRTITQQAAAAPHYPPGLSAHGSILARTQMDVQGKDRVVQGWVPPPPPSQFMLGLSPEVRRWGRPTGDQETSRSTQW